MQNIRQIMQKNPLSTFSGNRAKTEQTTTLAIVKTNTQQEKTSSHSTNPESFDKRIETLFVRLGAIYGHIWLSSYKNEQVLEITKKEWSEGLKRFDNRTLKEVLLICREQIAMPPSLPQFIECCKAVHKRYQLCSPVVHEPSQPSTFDVAQKHIKSMLDLLKS